MQTPNKQRGKGVPKLPEQPAALRAASRKERKEAADRAGKTTVLSLPSDAELTALQPPQDHKLSMWEQMVYGGRLNNPKTFESAHTNSPWLIALTAPYSVNDLHWWMQKKQQLSDIRRTPRRSAEVRIPNGDGGG